MPGRLYISNRCVNNILQCIYKWNNIDNPTEEDISTFLSKINSYYGFLRHTNSYAIRCRMWNLIGHKDVVKCSSMKIIKHI